MTLRRLGSVCLILLFSFSLPAEASVLIAKRLKQPYFEEEPLRRSRNLVNFGAPLTLPNDPLLTADGAWRQRAIRFISVPGAWNLSTGRGVVIGSADTGIMLDHEDLAANIYVNEIELNGIPDVDDDGNGYVDDIRGWDFLNDDNDASGGQHGTSTSGVYSAVGNNGVGMTGVAYEAKSMPLRIGGEDEGIFASAMFSALRYAADEGVRVMNLSVSFWHPRDRPNLDSVMANFRPHIEYARDHNLILVAAAGNSDVVIDNVLCYFEDSVITVSGMTTGTYFRGRAARGPELDFVTPWLNIFTTTAYGTGPFVDKYYEWSGTSFAAPMVTGVVALLLSQDPTLNFERVYSRLQYSALDLGDPGHDIIFGHGMVDAYRTLSFDYFAGGAIKKHYMAIPDFSGYVIEDFDETGRMTRREDLYGNYALSVLFDANAEISRDQWFNRYGFLESERTYFASGILESEEQMLTGVLYELEDRDFYGNLKGRILHETVADGTILSYEYWGFTDRIKILERRDSAGNLLDRTEYARDGKTLHDSDEIVNIYYGGSGRIESTYYLQSGIRAFFYDEDFNGEGLGRISKIEYADSTHVEYNRYYENSLTPMHTSWFDADGELRLSQDWSLSGQAYAAREKSSASLLSITHHIWEVTESAGSAIAVNGWPITFLAGNNQGNVVLQVYDGQAQLPELKVLETIGGQSQLNAIALDKPQHDGFAYYPFEYSQLMVGETTGSVIGVEHTPHDRDAFFWMTGSWNTRTQLDSGADEAAFGIVVNNSYRYYIVGETNGSLDGQSNLGGYDGFLWNTDDAGRTQWVRPIGTDQDDALRSITIDLRERIVAGGDTAGSLNGNVNQGGRDAFLIGLDADGNILWTKVFGSSGEERLVQIHQDVRGNIFGVVNTTGSLDSAGSRGGEDIFVFKLSVNGDLLWSRQIGTAVNDKAIGVVVDSNGFAAVVGQSEDQAFVALLDSETGRVRSIENWDIEGLKTVPQTVAINPLGDIVIGGYVEEPQDGGPAVQKGFYTKVIVQSESAVINKPVLGDYNRDGVFDREDLSAFLAAVENPDAQTDKGLGDFNVDGKLDALDVEAAFAVLIGNPNYSKPLEGDINADGEVNRVDLALFVHNFGKASGANWSHGDFDRDGRVALKDLILLRNNLGNSIAVPQETPGFAPEVLIQAVQKNEILNNHDLPEGMAIPVLAGVRQDELTER